MQLLGRLKRFELDLNMFIAEDTSIEVPDLVGYTSLARWLPQVKDLELNLDYNCDRQDDEDGIPMPWGHQACYNCRDSSAAPKVAD
jgi:hypothetical protein